MSATLYRLQVLNRLLDPLIAKYGEPDTVEVHVASNSFGAEFESRHWTWNLGSLRIFAIERAGEIDKSFISFSEPELKSEMDRRRETVPADTSNL